MNLKCSICKKNMIQEIKNYRDNKIVFYKTCKYCRDKQKNRYLKAKEAKGTVKITDEVKKIFWSPFIQAKKDAVLVLQNFFKQVIKNKKVVIECYICFNEFYKDIKGIECFQCKKSCCAYCYMTMFINTRDSVKCSLCRFQAHTKPYMGQNFSWMVESRAFRCGFKKKSHQYAWSRLVS